MSVLDRRVDTCGCCQPPAPVTPEHVFNRPALRAVRYRVGTYASFRQAMLQLTPPVSAELAAELGLAEPPLQRWTARDSDDYGVALVELWATIADVLTFYQERYANEAWLRPARQRSSIRRLAGLLGYRLAPGVAAATQLAFTVDEPLELPAGLRAQSVPRAGQNPEKFETDEPLAATDALNRVAVHARPQKRPQLAAGRTSGTLAEGSSVPAPGARFVAFSDGAGLEARTVEAVDTVGGRPVIRWSHPLGGAHTAAFLTGRSFRLFGHAAPPLHLVAKPAGDPDGKFLDWDEQKTCYEAAHVDLEGAVEGLEAGGRVLVVAAGVANLRTITAVEQAAGEVGPLTGTVTRLALADPNLGKLDVRATVVHELGRELAFQDWELPDGPIPAGSDTIYVPYPAVPALPEGRRLLLDDRHGDPMLVTVDRDAVPFAPGAEPEFLEVSLATPTTRDLDAASAHLLGNVAAASHGETVTGEVLGDGDAAAALQAFALAKAPLTHVADAAAPRGARSTLEVTVDGVRWSGRSSLFGAGPTDRVYTTDIDDEQTTTVRFGDGRFGTRLPTGRANVVAAYRQGLGAAGNVDAGQISTALDRPPGLRDVVNPLPATGGVDPETTEQARDNAPNTVRTFDRGVSLRDFADLARDFAGVAKAAATWVWDGEERVAHVTVGGVDGRPLGPRLGELRGYLDRRRDPHRALRIDEYRPLPFVVAVTVAVEPERLAEEVRHAVADALADHLAYHRRGFAQAVHLSDVYAAVQDVAGVAWALVDELRYKHAADALDRGVSAQPVLIRAPVLAARHDRHTDIVPAELAVIEDTADLAVTATGGLAS